MRSHRPATSSSRRILHAAGMVIEKQRFHSGARLGWHRHEGAYGCLLLAGSAREEVRGATFDLRPRDSTVRAPGLEHRAFFGPRGAVAVSIEVDAERFGPFQRTSFDPTGVIRRRAPHLAILGQRLVAELDRQDASSPLIVEGLGLEIVGELLRPCRDVDPSPPRWLARVHERLRHELDVRLTHEDLAKEAGVHPVHLAKTFRRFYGMPPGACHRRLRVERAAELLQSTDLPLAEVALAVGF